MQLLRLFPFLALLVAVAAHAQLRSIPADAKPATLRHVQNMVVELNDKPARLSPGAQIRDTHNRLVLPTSVVHKTRVRYLPDASGMVHRVWILSPQEAAQIPKTLPAPN